MDKWVVQLSKAKRRYPKSLGESLKGLLEQLGIEPQIKEYQVVHMWAEIVGENIANASVAEKVIEKVLYIKVKNMTWRTELLFQKTQILQKIENKIGPNVIQDIRFF
jgi:predicted nucleic acid-binding Zn ribbon protein